VVEKSESESPKARPAAPASPHPAKRWPIAPRTLRGLALALGLGVLVLVHYHVFRPWLAHHNIKTSMDEDLVSALKAVLAFSTIGLSVWALVRRLERKPFTARTITAGMVLCGALGIVAFIGSDDLGATSFVHKWELFHYYIGSKYPKELGYKRLYVCAAIAQSEFGPGPRAEVAARKIRDLETDVIQPAAPVLEHPEACKSHFTPERWKSFKKDVAYFRSTSNRDFFEGMSTDHGYNPPPVWTMLGHVVGSFFPEASNTSMNIMASIDTILFALMFFFVWWAFGLPTCCLVMVFFGVNLPANGYFTGGAFLRQDWLLFLVLAACLLRKHYWALAGASLVMSALLRIFPGFFFAGIVVVAFTYYVKHKKLAKHHVRVFAGAALAGVVLISSSMAVAGPDSYRAFFQHIGLHHRTPATNNMGMSVLLSFTPAGRAELTRDAKALDEFGVWADDHANALEKRRPAYLALNAFAALVFFLAARRVKTLWIAMGLSVILVVSVVTLSSYYYSFFLVPVLLGKVSYRLTLLTLLAAGMSAILLIPGRISFQFDDRFTLQSLVFVAYAFALVVAFLPPNREEVRAPAKAVQS
jgi:glycosyl transferase family 87